MSSGVVLSADFDYIIVFTADCKLVRVPNKYDVKIGQEISFDEEIKNQKSRSLFLRPLIAFAMAFVAVVSGLIIAHNVSESRAYAVMSIDVNPSIQFTLNKDLNITDVYALSPDAQAILVHNDYIGLSWSEASIAWLMALDKADYDIEDVLISAIVPESDDILIPQILTFQSDSDHDLILSSNIYVYYSHDLRVAQDAQANGVSVGHQMIINQFSQTNGHGDVNTINEKPLGEVVRILAQNGGMNQTEVTMPAIDTPAQTRPAASDSDHATQTIPSQSGGPPETVPSQSSGPPETVPSQSSEPSDTTPSQSIRPNETRPTNPRSTESGRPSETPPSNPGRGNR